MFINIHQQLMMAFGCNGSEIGKAPESTAPAGKAKEQMFEAEVRQGVFAMPIFFRTTHWCTMMYRKLQVVGE